MSRKTIAVIVLFVSLFGVTILQAQTLRDGWISGRVYDEKTLEPVVGAYILVPGMGHIDISDKDGNFLLTNLWPGDYDLLISSSDYSTVRIKHVIVVADSTTVISQHLSKKTTLPDTVLVEYYERIHIRAKQVGRISGHVFDKETSKPVVGATVYIVGTKLGAVSDFDGSFLIARLDPGDYNLQISTLEYTTMRIDSVMVVADSTTEISQHLLKKTIRLDTIFTDYIPRDIRPNPTVISQQDIDTLPDTAADSVPWYAGLTDTDYFSIVVPEAELSRLIDSLGHNEFMLAITDFLRVIDSIRPWLHEVTRYSRGYDRKLDFILFRLMQEDFFAEAFGPNGLDITESALESYDEYHRISSDSTRVFSSEEFKDSYEVFAQSWRSIAETFRPLVDSRDQIRSMSVVVGGYGRINVEKNKDSDAIRIFETYIIGMGISVWNGSYTDSLQVEQYVQIRNFSTHFHVLYPFLSQDTVRYYIIMVLKKE